MTVSCSKGVAFSVLSGVNPRFVKTVARCSTDAVGADSVSVGVRLNLDLDVDGPRLLGAAFSNETRLMSVNPITGLAWTCVDVNALQWAIVTGAPLPPPPPGTPFQVVQVVPVNSNTLRVYFSREPRHLSPISVDDALNRLNYVVALLVAPPRVTTPVVEGVENAQERPDDLATFPDAWSVDLRLDRRIVFDATYVTVASPLIRAVDGSPMEAPPDDRDEHPGAVELRPRLPVRPSSARAGIDFRYDLFEGTLGIDAKGDVDIHAGAAAARKRIIRRILTRPGGFPHLPNYGVGLKAKELFDTTRLDKIRSEVLRQILEETDVERASVDVSASAGVLFLKVAAKLRTGQAVSFGVRLDEEGTTVS